MNTFLFALTLILPALSFAAAPAPGVNPGDLEAVALKKLGEPVRRFPGARPGHSRWIYPESSGRKVELHLSGGRVDSLRTSVFPALQAKEVISPTLPLFEINMAESGDSRSGVRYFAHPESGQVWTVDPKGRVSGWTRRPTWKSKNSGKPLATLLRAQGARR